MPDTTTPMDTSLDEVLAEMDDRTRVGWDAAVARVENRKLRDELARLRNAQNPAAPEVPPAGEPTP